MIALINWQLQIPGHNRNISGISHTHTHNKKKHRGAAAYANILQSFGGKTGVDDDVHRLSNDGFIDKPNTLTHSLYK